MTEHTRVTIPSGIPPRLPERLTVPDASAPVFTEADAASWRSCPRYFLRRRTKTAQAGCSRFASVEDALASDMRMRAGRYLEALYGPERVGLSVTVSAAAPALETVRLEAEADAVIFPEEGGAVTLVFIAVSTRVKAETLFLCAFRRYVFEAAGTPVASTAVLHLDGRYVRDGELDPGALFALRDVTGELEPHLETIEPSLSRMLEALSVSAEPRPMAEGRCRSPSNCPFAELCRSELPRHHLYTLHRGKEHADRLLRAGIRTVTELPSGTRLTERQRIQREAVVTGAPYIDRAALARFLARLEYPLRFLDFECFALPVPQFSAVRPLQSIPFQYSLHTRAAPLEPAVHTAYLAPCGTDPRPGLAESLSRSIGESGSIVVFNRSFEARMLSDLAAAFPEHEPWVGSALGRLVDLCEPFERFAFYHPDQEGRISVKSLLPLFSGKRFESLPVSNGRDASLAYLAACGVPGAGAGSPGPDAADKAGAYGVPFSADGAAADVSAGCRTPSRILDDLLVYSALDTESLVIILDGLSTFVDPPR